MPRPAAHATQPLWKSRDWGALQRSDAAASPWQRVTSCLGAQGPGSPGAHGCVSAPGWRGTRLWVQGQGTGVAVGVPVHPARAEPRPGLGKGMRGPYTEREPPQNLLSPSPAVTQAHPELCHRPPAPAQDRRQRRVTLRVLLLSLCRWDRGTKECPPCSPPPICGCKSAENSTPFAAGASPATLCPQGHPEHPAVALRSCVGQCHRASTHRVPYPPVQHSASPIRKSQRELGLTIS